LRLTPTESDATPRPGAGLHWDSGCTALRGSVSGFLMHLKTDHRQWIRLHQSVLSL
jgi:hypothetical protein